MSQGVRQDWIASNGMPLRGSVRVPGDKSISHRAVILAALADGVSEIDGFLEGDDTCATARVFAELGVRIETPAATRRVIHGVGLHGLRGSHAPLDCGNAGTAMRLLAGVLAGQAFESELVGDASLSRRPMGRVIEPLTAMGARIQAVAGSLPPLRIAGGRRLQGIDYTPPVASAQVKSAVLLAGLYASGETVLREPQPTRDYTERMLAAFGWPITCTEGVVRLHGGHRLHATRIAVPGDFSSAAFFVVAACLVPGSELRIEAVGMNPRRTGLLQALRLMGADIREDNRRELDGEPVADLVVRHAQLRGIDLPAALVPDMIDECPILFVAAACASGTTVIRGAAELRVKESDRIATMATGLRALGISIRETADGAVIEGGRPRGGMIDSLGDHRIAMSFAVIAQMATADIRIADVGNVATSFPGFTERATTAGMGLAGIGSTLAD